MFTITCQMAAEIFLWIWFRLSNYSSPLWLDLESVWASDTPGNTLSTGCCRGKVRSLQIRHAPPVLLGSKLLLPFSSHGLQTSPEHSLQTPVVAPRVLETNPHAGDRAKSPLMASSTKIENVFLEFQWLTETYLKITSIKTLPPVISNGNKGVSSHCLVI